MPEDILSILMQLLVDNWNPVNTESITPDFHDGPLSPQKGPHQVFPKNVPNEDALGTSGFHGMNPATGGGNQMFKGMVFIDSYSQQGDTLPHPDLVTRKFTDEIMRIVRENTHLVTGYDYVSFLGINRKPPQQGELPLSVTRSSRIGFQWRIDG